MENINWDHATSLSAEGPGVDETNQPPTEIMNAVPGGLPPAGIPRQQSTNAHRDVEMRIREAHLGIRWGEIFAILEIESPQYGAPPSAPVRTAAVWQSVRRVRCFTALFGASRRFFRT